MNTVSSIAANKMPYLLVALFAIFNIFYNMTLPLYVDEAYYWVWSQKLQLSYFDHPPMIAYLIRLSTEVFGDNELGVRMVSVMCMSGSAVYIYRLGLLFAGEQAALFSLIAFLLSPAVSMGYTIASPDAPLILFYSGAMYYGYKALFEGGIKNFVLTGACIGLALISKYTAVLFLGFLAIFLLLKRPRLLISGRSWLSILVAAIIFLPVIIWNSQHDWISFLFQYRHGSSEAFLLKPEKFLEFLGGAALIFNPLFFGLIIFKSAKEFRLGANEKRFFIMLGFLFLMAFFGYKAMFKKMELNWVAPAFIAGAIYLGALISEGGYKRVFILGCLLSALLSATIKYPALLGLKGNLNIQNRIFGPKEAAQEAAKFIHTGDAIYSDHLTNASALKFYLPGHPDVRIPTKTRFSQYSLWETEQEEPFLGGVYIGANEVGDELNTIFSHVQLLELYEAKKDGYNTKRYYIYSVKGKK